MATDYEGRELHALAARDRHGYGHEPQRYDIGGDLDTAIEDARQRYGKATGLGDLDISIDVL